MDSIEHGFELDADIAAEMAARGCALVTTMTVLKSWLTFGTTTAMPRFTERTAEIGQTLETAMASVTWRGGELLGEPDAGVIREGGPADFSLVHGDPHTDPTAMWRIWRVA